MESQKKKKHVTFSDYVMVCGVCVCDDHVVARRGSEWLQEARDRRRFKRRINIIGIAINHVLEKKLFEMRIK